jgi:hypothetical protein
VRELVDTGERALQTDRPSFEVTWRVARGYWWLARTQENRTFKKALAVKAIDWAGRALELDGAHVEGHYVYAISVGEYATCIGITTAVMQDVAGKFEGAMLKSYEMDRDIDNGGPITALGRYYYVLPWPKRDLGRSLRYLEEVRQRHPDSLLGRVFLAETYYAQGEKDRARAELEYVIRAEPSSGPDYDGPQAKSTAAQRLAEWFA